MVNFNHVGLLSEIRLHGQSAQIVRKDRKVGLEAKGKKEAVHNGTAPVV